MYKANQQSFLKKQRFNVVQWRWSCFHRQRRTLNGCFIIRLSNNTENPLFSLFTSTKVWCFHRGYAFSMFQLERRPERLTRDAALLHNRQTLFGPSLLRCWRVNASRPWSIRGRRANQACTVDRICTVSTDGTSWTGGGAFLIGCQSASVSGSPAITHTQTHERSFGEAKLFASKLPNLGSDRNTRVNRLGIGCNASAVSCLLEVRGAH